MLPFQRTLPLSAVCGVMSRCGLQARSTAEKQTRILVKVDKADGRGQHVPSSILSIAACGNNNDQWVTAYKIME